MEGNTVSSLEAIVERRTRRRRQAGLGPVLVPLGIVVAALFAIRLLGLQEVGWIQNALLILSGLLVEALPFVLLGAIVSAAIEIFLPVRVFERLARVPQRFQVGAAAFGGMAFPVCECGSVPVARRLLRRGLNPSAAVTFMLAAPIVNPIVILSTIFAFQGRDILLLMVGGRVVLGLGVAVVGGVVAGRELHRGGDRAAAGSVLHGHDHDHDHDRESSRTGEFFAHMASDFSFMARFMMIGALVAALVQTVVPQNAIEEVAATALLAILAMMVFAFVLSLCSESDAILIASFTQFTPASQLAFLVFGPMLDTKLVALYSGAFGRRFLRALVPALVLATIIGCLWVEALDRIW